MTVKTFCNITYLMNNQNERQNCMLDSLTTTKYLITLFPRNNYMLYVLLHVYQSIISINVVLYYILRFA